MCTVNVRSTHPPQAASAPTSKNAGVHRIAAEYKAKAYRGKMLNGPQAADERLELEGRIRSIRTTVAPML